MKMGLIIGKFLPLHNGHIFFINKSATYVDKLFIIVDEDDENDSKIMKKFNMTYPDLLTRMKWLTSIYKDTPHVEIISMNFRKDETSQNERLWANKVKEVLKETKIDTIFSSNRDNEKLYSKVFPKWEQKYLSKNGAEKIIPTSTIIRKNIYAYWHQIPSVVREFYVKKVVLVGGESVGKTTLVRAMAKAFGTSWSEEYGRKFCEEKLGKWYDRNNFVLTSEKDYETIVIKQDVQNEKAFNRSNKIVLIDTDAIYTQSFFESQFHKKNKLIEQFITKQKKEFIYIFLSSNVPFINDGFRANKNRDLIKNYYLKYIKFDYEIKDNSYTERFEKLFKILKNQITKKK